MLKIQNTILTTTSEFETPNSSIPTPKEIIGHEVGEWHVTHDKWFNTCMHWLTRQIELP